VSQVTQALPDGHAFVKAVEKNKWFPPTLKSIIIDTSTKELQEQFQLDRFQVLNLQNMKCVK